VDSVSHTGTYAQYPQNVATTAPATTIWEMYVEPGLAIKIAGAAAIPPATLEIEQLHHLAEWNAVRKAQTGQYTDPLYERCQSVLPPSRKSQGSSSSNHIVPVVLPEKADRQDVADTLRDRGIQTTICYSPVPLLFFHRKNHPAAPLPLPEEFAQRKLCLSSASKTGAGAHPKNQKSVLAIWNETGRPIPFSQMGLEYRREQFRIYKFRKFHPDNTAPAPADC
jgi:hypothetical protein